MTIAIDGRGQRFKVPDSLGRVGRALSGVRIGRARAPVDGRAVAESRAHCRTDAMQKAHAAFVLGVYRRLGELPLTSVLIDQHRLFVGDFEIGPTGQIGLTVSLPAVPGGYPNAGQIDAAVREAASEQLAFRSEVPAQNVVVRTDFDSAALLNDAGAQRLAATQGAIVSAELVGAS